ncbi:MAG: gliding motility-associated protein GldE [Bacteroidetes bacterium]|nr:gliding motility-associated protein GldE [Bacteroidota bacterium]
MEDPLSYSSLPLETALVLLPLLIVSGLISASEVAFFGASPKTMEELEFSHPAAFKKASHLLAHPNRLLATILIANNFTNILIVLIASLTSSGLPFMSDWPAWLQFAFQALGVTTIILIFGEILPKILATHQSKGIIVLMSTPLSIAGVVTRPLGSLLLLSGRLITGKATKGNQTLSNEELSAVIDMAEGVEISDEERKIWKGIVEFGKITSSETMKPRTDIVGIELKKSFKQVLDVILRSGYSRIPVYNGSLDQVTGILYVKDLIPFLSEDAQFNWNRLVRKPFFVPENKPIDDLLKEFQLKKMHMAIVVDEYGGCSGLITLEDIIEEIVGEINDEFDDEEIVYSKLDDHTFVFEAKTTLIQLCRIVDIPFESLGPAAEEADTIAGLLLQLHQKLPAKGIKIDTPNIEYCVESADQRRIKRVKVTLKKRHDFKSGIAPSFLACILGLSLIGCNTDVPQPKPMGYPLIELPSQSSKTLQLQAPFQFEIAQVASIRPATERPEFPGGIWLNIDYPDFRSTIYLTYLPVNKNLAELLDEANQQVYKGHVTMAEGIEEQTISDSKRKVYGRIYHLEGPVATPVQFYLTDSSQHFVRGSLYFNYAANYDSIAPILTYLNQDIERMAQSLAWKP